MRRSATTTIAFILKSFHRLSFGCIERTMKSQKRRRRVQELLLKCVRQEIELNEISCKRTGRDKKEDKWCESRQKKNEDENLFHATFARTVLRETNLSWKLRQERLKETTKDFLLASVACFYLNYGTHAKRFKRY